MGINLANLGIKGAFLGNTPIQCIYMGDKLVWPDDIRATFPNPLVCTINYSFIVNNDNSKTPIWAGVTLYSPTGWYSPNNPYPQVYILNLSGTYNLFKTPRTTFFSSTAMFGAGINNNTSTRIFYLRRDEGASELKMDNQTYSTIASNYVQGSYHGFFLPSADNTAIPAS